jgi:electron transfer flavoprotein alpha subunit
MKNGILILVEHLKGVIGDITFEMLGIGRKIADELKIPLYGIILGKNIQQMTSNLGIVDSLFIMDNEKLEMPCPSIIAKLLHKTVQQKEISLVFIAGTNVSAGIGPLLSCYSKNPFLNFCRNIKIENNNISITSQLFGGKILSEVSLKSNKGIISIYPGSFPIDAGESAKTPVIENIDFPVDEAKCNFKKYIEPEAGDVDITKQDVLVSVGRGIENEGNLSLAEEIVSLIGGAVCASRPVIDQGWLPLNRQVGKSGMIVKPKLYLALGISGAPEHVEGMKDSELIIAINKDPSAPIFNVARYGVCSDINDVVPALIDELKKRKGG